MFIAASGGFFGILVVIAVVALRRQKKADMAMIDTWDSFGDFSSTSKPPAGKTLVNLEGGAMDGAEEVLAEDEMLELEESPPAEEPSSEQKPVAGIDLDWDDV